MKPASCCMCISSSERACSSCIRALCDGREMGPLYSNLCAGSSLSPSRRLGRPRMARINREQHLGPLDLVCARARAATILAYTWRWCWSISGGIGRLLSHICRSSSGASDDRAQVAPLDAPLCARQQTWRPTFQFIIDDAEGSVLATKAGACCRCQQIDSMPVNQYLFRAQH